MHVVPLYKMYAVDYVTTKWKQSKMWKESVGN